MASLAGAHEGSGSRRQVFLKTHISWDLEGMGKHLSSSCSINLEGGQAYWRTHKVAPGRAGNDEDNS